MVNKLVLQMVEDSYRNVVILTLGAGIDIYNLFKIRYFFNVIIFIEGTILQLNFLIRLSYQVILLQWARNCSINCKRDYKQSLNLLTPQLLVSYYDLEMRFYCSLGFGNEALMFS